jgi:uroporphyrinogen III methyltransferase/synthase
MSGRVYLVGAGPGDPGLLTRRAERCLAAADVVVHDYLVSASLLSLVRPQAELVAVGRSHDARLAQADIEALLVTRARAGKVVVRLKNGDPFLFGRGGEEAEALRRAGIPFEVVPGVSSALAVPAHAGIPLTHRDHASLVTIATGHQALDDAEDGPVAPALPWASLVGTGGTLVFLMGMRALSEITSALIAHGMAPDTPAAVVVRGTTARQARVVATVATIAAEARAAGLGAPGVVVVGSVVGLGERLAWAEARPLFGRRIVVTRAREQAAGLADLLEAHGAEVILFPTIALAPPEDPAPLDRAVAAAASYDWMFFTSVNGVRAFFAAFAASGRDVRELSRVSIGAIGPETAAELERRLLRPELVPEEYRAEGLVRALEGKAVAGARVLLPRASGARSVLPDALRARGATVDEVIAYRAVAPAGVDVEGLAKALAAGDVDAVTFTSSSTVRHFVDMIGPQRVAAIARAARPVVACIGPVTAETAAEAGLTPGVVPASYTVRALADALVEHFCKGGADPLCEGRR